MATTVLVSEETRRRLAAARDAMKAGSMDEAIQRLARLRIRLARLYHKVEPTILYQTAVREVPRRLAALQAQGP